MMTDAELLEEVNRVASYLASMPSGTSTLPTAGLRMLLTQTEGWMFARGVLCNIRAKSLGAGVHRVWLTPRRMEVR